jgi:membrane associated rhomboid family serine protease
MINKSHFVRCLWIVAGVIGLLWAVRVYDAFLPPDLNHWGIEPRTVRGLPGIATAPLLHEGWSHLLSNTTPLIVLLLLLFATQRKPWLVVLELVLLSGALLWIVGRNSIHVGASSLIFALITYLIGSAWLHRKLAGVLVGLLVLVLYGGSLLTGVVPQVQSTVSWEGHLCGAISGVIVAWHMMYIERRDESVLAKTRPSVEG